MSWAFLRREWGAVTFVLAVLVGAIVVPLSLAFTTHGQAANVSPGAVPAATASPSPAVSGARTISPSPSP
ncbi:MAG: hypothetical protein M3024_09470 [Candidatus Dormibacteraeota bacterium]|nr:hypothetical protein [Candidatus Dormibacteraeota bacterium]